MGPELATPPSPAGPKATMPQTLPVVVLLKRAPLILELPDIFLALGELLRQPPLLPTPLAQFCFSLPRPGAGSQERLLHPRQLWGWRAWRCHCRPTQPVPSGTQTWDAGGLALPWERWSRWSRRVRLSSRRAWFSPLSCSPGSSPWA